MADPAPTNIPTLSSSDMQSIAQAMGVDPRQLGAGQGQGSSYLSLIPSLIQGQYSNANIGAAANSAPVQWLIQNGYITSGGDAGGFQPGWRSSGITGQSVQPGQTTIAQLTKTGAYDPSQDIGTGWQDAQGMVPLVGANPFGVAPTIGALDRSNIASPTQDPGQFGTSIWGPTENPGNMVQNQDWMSRYGIPIMELLAGSAFGAVGGFGELGGIGKSLFSLGGSDVQNAGNGNTINPAQILPVILKMLG